MTLALRDHLEQAFGRAEPDHYAWQTRCPYVSERERILVRSAFEPLGARVIDLGCGEGATLAHLGAPARAVGVDLFEAKVAFARDALPGCDFVAASVEALPFDDGRFDHVIVRDLVHHLDAPERLIDEAHRVLAPGGRIDVLEPCRYNPLILAHALLMPAERGELRSTPRYLASLMERRFAVAPPRVHQALPLHRVLFHPTLGSPRLAHRGAVRRFVHWTERVAERVIPRSMWSYVHLRGTKS